MSRSRLVCRSLAATSGGGAPWGRIPSARTALVFTLGASLWPAAARAEDEGWRKVEETESAPAADDAPRTKHQLFRKPGLDMERGAWALLLGAYAGASAERQVGHDQGNADKSGYTFAGKMLGTRYTAKWIFDVGVGWHYSAMEGNENVANKDGVYEKKLVTIESQAATLDLGADYRLGRYWGVGGILSQMFGDDLSFGSGKKNVGAVTVGGLNVSYSDVGPSSVLRYRMQALTDLSIPSRRVTWLMLGVDIGLPLIGYDRERRVDEVTFTDRRTEETVVEKPVPVDQRVRVISTPLDPELLPFDAASGDVTAKALPFVRDLCGMVGRTAAAFERVEFQYVLPSPELGNDDQSRASARGEAMARHCREAGVPEAKVKGEGILVKPQAGESFQAYVNVRFYRVADEDVLRREIVDLQKRYRQPETCRNGTCR